MIDKPGSEENAVSMPELTEEQKAQLEEMAARKGSPVMLHVLPTFDLGGLGSFALELVRAWPDEVRHVVVAPRYPRTRPDLLYTFGQLCRPGNVAQKDRDLMKPMKWVDDLYHLMAKLSRGGPLRGVINYNVGDFVWTVQAVRRLGYRGQVACHVGTVLPPEDRHKAVFNSPHAWNCVFVPASKAIADGMRDNECPAAVFGDVCWNGIDLHGWESKVSVDPVRLAAQNLRVADAALRAQPYPGIGAAQTSQFQLQLYKLRRAVPLRFGFVGRMAPEAKDWATLIDGFGQLPTAMKDRCVLQLVGGGPKRKEIEEHVSRVGARVEFLGEKKPHEVKEWLLSELDCFVMAALPIEGMSMALVEAVCAGLPIISTDVTSCRETLSEVEALLVKSAAELSDAVERLVRNETKLIGMAQSSERARPLFDVQRVSKHYRGLFT